MVFGKKKGISPVIATVLLISLALILAVIVFLWARSFIGENIEKQQQSVDLVCERVSFSAEAVYADEKIYVQNNGDVPIYGVEVRKKRLIGDIKKVGRFSNLAIYTGETGEVDMDTLETGDELVIAPILLGETSTEKKAYVCDQKYGAEITVE